MLKTNSTKARENIRAYIMKIYNEEFSDSGKKPESFEEAKEEIRKQFEYATKGWNDTPQSKFKDWLCGLPGILSTEDYFCHNSAVSILGDILEQPKYYRGKYCEFDSELMISKMIAREILN